MANMQTECLNDKCSNQISNGYLWCSLDCKKQFLLKNYSDGQCNLWFKEADKDFRIRQTKVLSEIKASGLSVRDFLLTLGDFKDIPVEDNAENTKSELNSQQNPSQASEGVKIEASHNQHRTPKVVNVEEVRKDIKLTSTNLSADTQIQNEINKDYAKEGFSEQESGK